MVYIWVVGITRIIRRVVKDELEGGVCARSAQGNGKGDASQEKEGKGRVSLVLYIRA